MEDWERYRRIPREKIEKDRDSRNMVFHAMLVAIQSAIDIATDINQKIAHRIFFKQCLKYSFHARFRRKGTSTTGNV